MNNIELTPKEIRAIESSDAYFVIGVKDGKHFTIAKGKLDTEEKNVEEITQGMLGCINLFLKQRVGNGLIIVATVVNAVKNFPELLKSE